MSWVLPGSLLPWECECTSVRILGTSLPEEAAGLGRGCSEPRDRIPARGCSRGEGGEAPSQPAAGLGGAGGWLQTEEEEKARIFLNERLAPHPTPPPGSRLPCRRSPVPLGGAASFYSDGAEPRLFRVVTKPGLRGDAAAGAEDTPAGTERGEAGPGGAAAAGGRPREGPGLPAGRAAATGKGGGVRPSVRPSFLRVLPAVAADGQGEGAGELPQVRPRCPFPTWPGRGCPE